MAEPKKKIIIKKKVIKKTAPSGDAGAKSDDDVVKEYGAKLKVGPKKIQVTKKKAAAKSQPIPPPPEVVSTQSEKQMGLEREKTMIAEAPTPVDESPKTAEPAGKKPTFKFYCIRCGQKLEAYYDWVDREIGCPRCKAKIKIPEPLS